MTGALAHLQFTKHHGAGNDFLVTLDVDATSPLDPELVAALCHRHHGVGADGVIRVLGGEDGADLAMELRNADGGLAETSGNGLRCLAQAAVDAGLVASPAFTVWTAAGVRTIEYEPGLPGLASAWVGMGRPELGPHEQLDTRVGPDVLSKVQVARLVDVGNPHLVVIGPDPSAIDVARWGQLLAEQYPPGRNVEFVAVDADGALRMGVWERGVGLTRACGTGSVAAAAAAREAGLAGDRVRVHNPGGTLEVAFDGAEARLGGPVHKVADIAVDVAALLSAEL